VLLLSGLARQLVPSMGEAALHNAQVLIGPLCNDVGNHWFRGWLAAEQRDRVMTLALSGSIWVTLAGAIVALALPQAQQLPVVAGLCLLNCALVLWLGVRAFLLGDRIAIGMAVGAALALPAIGGLYALATQAFETPEWVQALLALACVGSNLCTALMVWMRVQQHRRVDGQGFATSRIDPVTRLPSGSALVQRLIRAQQRRRRTRREGALIAVLLFDQAAIVRAAGTAGANEMAAQLAARLQRQVGVVNPVGRYYDRCFICLIETIDSPARLRTLGLRVAAALRKPLDIAGSDGESLDWRADIGVGIVHLTREPADVEDILHEAEQLAEAARSTRSRTAMRDPSSGAIVPVEQADLGPRRHPAAMRHAVPQPARTVSSRPALRHSRV